MSDLFQTVKDMYAAFGRGDVQAIMEHVSEDVVWEAEGPDEMGYTGIRHDKQQTLGFFEGIAREQGDPHLEMTEYIISGNSVAVFGRYQATVKRLDKRVDAPLGHLFQFRDGKVARFVNLTDTAAYVRA